MLTIMVLVTVLVLVTAVGSLHAEGISLLTDLEYFNTNDTITDKESGSKTDNQFTRFTQVYNVAMAKQLFPNLSFSAGSFFEFDKLNNDADGTETEFRERTMRPFMEVNLANPLYRAGFVYRRTEKKENPSAMPTTRTFMDDYSGNFNWRPVALPSLNINYRRSLVHDQPKTVDQTNETLSLLSKYVYKGVEFDYTYNRRQEKEQLSDAGSLTQIHNGGIFTSRNFYDNRLRLSAGSRVDYTETVFSGAGESRVRTAFPGSAFYLLDDSTPVSNLAGEFTDVGGAAPLSTVNIGRNGGFNPVSAGLDFSVRTEVDAVYILLEKDDQNPNLAIPSQIAGIAASFTWSLYASDDRENWTAHGIATVTYNSFYHRFEIVFASPIDAQYLKIVVLPQVFAPGEIRLADIQAFTTVAGGSRVTIENLNQFYTFGAEWRPTTSTSAGYNVNYRHRETKPDGEVRTSLVNGVNVRHQFNPVFSTTARLLRSDATQTGESDLVSYTYSTALRADFFDTLRQSLIYSGTRSDEDEGSSTTNAVVLRTSADLYEGWSMNLDLGYAWNSLQESGDQTSKFLRLDTVVVPHNKLHLDFSYEVYWNTQEDEEDSTRQKGSIHSLLVVTDTINMTADYNFTDRQGPDNDSTFLQDYALNWAPFRDGTLQFSLSYTESISSENNEEKFLSPSIKWQVAKGMLMELRYNTGTIETAREKLDTDNVYCNLRLFY
ncbi:MAG: hypothetical protein JXO49_01485 [Deltaproteobacteria bacterium]|nr:hypothetical protein [Candidatus Anaeroferrophillus wilburensis]MBN2888000.1 hypothetical protein [Deltaproteobacteria bacterium]